MSCSSTLPACYPVSYYEGNTWIETIRLRDGVTKEPIVLSAAAVLIEIKKKKTDTTAEETLSIGDGLSIVGVDQNEISIDKILDLDAGAYFWDLTITFSDGTVRTFLAGDFTVEQRVSVVTA